MLSRLETMVLMGLEIPLEAIRRQIASGVDIIVHLGRMRDKSRKVLEITEVLGYGEGEIILQTLFAFHTAEGGEHENKIRGELIEKNKIVHKEKLLAAGYQ